MTTIQDRIIKDFDKEVVDKCWNLPSNRVNSQRLSINQQEIIKQFLIQSIKKVADESRREVEDFIMNRDNCSLVKQQATIKNGVVNTYLYDGDLILKSLTNKEDK